MIPFKAVREAVEGTLRKTFSTKELGQLLAVYPDTCRVLCLRGVDEYIIEQVNKPGQSANLYEVAKRSRDRRLAFRQGLVAHYEECFCEYADSGNCKEKFCHDLHVRDIVAVKMPLPGCDISCTKPRIKETRIPFSNVHKLSARHGVGSALNKRKSEVLRKNKENQDNTMPLQMTLKNTKRLRGLKGLPASLIQRVNERNAIEKQMRPEALLQRTRSQARASLPSFLDMLFLFFRTTRKSKLEFGKLVKEIVTRLGPNSFGPAIRDYDMKLQIVKEQLELLLELVPEWCKISESKINKGEKLFHVNVSDNVNIARLREKTMQKSC
mmetsp:Transcript_18229/g.31047  ORF Transcript_18229/g.31047 Transcript_18229/m.31047 type:complete len:325 (-) Transcript_18229:1231-2205(-)